MCRARREIIATGEEGGRGSITQPLWTLATHLPSGMLSSSLLSATGQGRQRHCKGHVGDRSHDLLPVWAGWCWEWYLVHGLMARR